jgi:hypothetical protein
MSDVQSMTYAELAAALGIGADSARNLVRRRRWHRSAGNDGMARVAVPLDYLDRASPSPGDAPGDPHADAAADGATHPPIAELATSLLMRHITRLENEIEELRGERDRAREKASDRDGIAAQLRSLRAELYQLRDDRGHWRHLAERLALAPPAARRWRWPWKRITDLRLASAGTPGSGDASGSRGASADSPPSLLDESTMEISASDLERALERLAREAEHPQPIEAR